MDIGRVNAANEVGKVTKVNKVGKVMIYDGGEARSTRTFKLTKTMTEPATQLVEVDEHNLIDRVDQVKTLDDFDEVNGVGKIRGPEGVDEVSEIGGDGDLDWKRSA